MPSSGYAAQAVGGNDCGFYVLLFMENVMRMEKWRLAQSPVPPVDEGSRHFPSGYHDVFGSPLLTDELAQRLRRHVGEEIVGDLTSWLEMNKVPYARTIMRELKKVKDDLPNTPLPEASDEAAFPCLRPVSRGAYRLFPWCVASTCCLSAL